MVINGKSVLEHSVTHILKAVFSDRKHCQKFGHVVITVISHHKKTLLFGRACGVLQEHTEYLAMLTNQNEIEPVKSRGFYLWDRNLNIVIMVCHSTNY